ncbi:MAG: hypothetical protein M1828_006689 [Chrysothrix sp. TS-e1954]|nr:MAG: hypothetical protein M1828_006689 [Chrysothrix sp. TS-e1954]
MPTSAPLKIPSLPYNIAFFLLLQSNLIYSVAFPGSLLASCALTWLFIRFNQVLRKPVDDLVRILGLEVPQPPEPSILEIKSDGVSLRWEPPDHKGSVVKYAIQVNGILTGEIAAHETSISIAGLPAGKGYTVRVVAINSANFQASSEAVRIQTTTGDEQTNVDPTPSANDGKDGHAAPVVMPYKGYHEALLSPASAPAMAREHSGSLPSSKRGPAMRRPSPQAPVDSDPKDHHLQDSEADDTVQELNARLEQARLEIDEAERQMRDEQDEYEAERAELAQRKEELRERLRDKEGESKELRKDVTSLERQNTAAQNKKQAQEKALQAKTKERERMQDDIERWDREVTEMEEEAETLSVTEAEAGESVISKLQEIRAEQEGDLQAIKQFDQQIKETGTQVKHLEEQRKTYEDGQLTHDTPPSHHTHAQEDIEWEARLHNLQEQYKAAWFELSNANALRRQIQDRWELLTSQHPGFFQSNHSMESLPTSNEVQGMAPGPFRAQVGGGSALRYGANPDSRLSHSTSLRSRRPPSLATANLRSPSPYFNTANMSTEQLRTQPMPGSFDSLMEGALTSPTAGGLLPSDLLDNDHDEARLIASQTRRQQEPVDTRESRSSSGANSSMRVRNRHDFSESGRLLPGLGMVPGQESQEAVNGMIGGLISPNSIDSRSPSLQSSPHGSIAGSHRQRLSEGLVESDRRSTRSASTSSRARHSVFGPFLWRQRGKTMSDDGPALGSLTSHQSQSMPHDFDQGDLTKDSTGDANRPQPAPGLLGSMGNAMLGRRLASTRASAVSDQSSSHAGPFSVFGMRGQPWARTSLRDSNLSRPSSVYSAENALPPPSEERQPFGWNDGGISRASSTRMSQHSGYPWSTIPSSRRGSVQVESTMLPDLDEDGHDTFPDKSATRLAPIGTKPSKANKGDAGSSQLNPGARSFSSMFSRDRKNEKSEAKERKSSEKAEKKAKSKDRPNSNGDALGITTNDSSPDTQRTIELPTPSIHSTEELSVISESAPSTPLDGTPTPSSANRESFMRKITRKGSSSKFSLSSLKARKTAGGANVQGEDVGDEDSASASMLGRSVDSTTSSPQIGTPGAGEGKRSSAFSLSNFKKKGKKTDAPSISETSTSEHGDETGDASGRTSADD